MNKNENLSIGFIGAGRVGFTLARYFYEKNLKLSGFSAELTRVPAKRQSLLRAKLTKTSRSLQRRAILFL